MLRLIIVTVATVVVLSLLLVGCFVAYEARKYPVCPKCGDNSQTRRIDKNTARCQIHGTFKT